MLFYSTLSLAVHLVATITFTFHIREIHNESVVHVHVTSKITTATATQLCCQTFYCILKINSRKSPGDKLKSLDTRRKKHKHIKIIIAILCFCSSMQKSLNCIRAAINEWCPWMKKGDKISVNSKTNCTGRSFTAGSKKLLDTLSVWMAPCYELEATD